MWILLFLTHGLILQELIHFLITIPSLLFLSLIIGWEMLKVNESVPEEAMG